ncbi:MAG: non-homologous end-joining DNA ligase [Bacillota bacterium]|nr:non-homologous end-joining DNA ligase [Bacillota bacterium]
MLIEGREIRITNPNKVLFPKHGITKAELIEYYIRMSGFILPWLRDRPFTMVPYPDGVEGKSFYQKQRPEDAPSWLRSISITSETRGHIDWILVNDLPSLVYMVNRACIEMHAWFSRAPWLEAPDMAVFDIDPSGNTGFADAVAASRLIKIILDEYKLSAYVKTSGMLGVHIIVPIRPTPFNKVRGFLQKVCLLVEEADPSRFTAERMLDKRGDRVYLDALQDARGKTIPTPYSVRAHPDATVSMPLEWDELFNEDTTPGQFTVRTIEKRIEEKGDLFAPIYGMKQKLPGV